jgi:hypothetical protein
MPAEAPVIATTSGLEILSCQTSGYFSFSSFSAAEFMQ